jgi:hypothetical protein
MCSKRVAAALALALLAGCGTVSADATGAPVALRDAVRADAARGAGVADAAVRIVRAEAVTWRDGSLGCPRAGLAYPQALVAGWLVEAEAAGQRWRYHANAAGRWLQCDLATAQEPLPEGDRRWRGADPLNGK